MHNKNYKKNALDYYPDPLKVNSWFLSGVLARNFEHVCHNINLVLFVLVLNIYLPARYILNPFQVKAPFLYPLYKT